MADDSGSPWYSGGLRFACTRCGACCTGAPGFVWVDAEAVATLAAFLGMEPDDFSMKYVRRVGDRHSLMERPGGDCIFWSRESGCTVYPARPIQCRTWPFWSENIDEPASWARVGRGCPGVDSGPRFTVHQIEAAAERTPG